MMLREVPDHIRLDNGPESTARVVREWVDRVIEEEVVWTTTPNGSSSANESGVTAEARVGDGTGIGVALGAGVGVTVGVDVTVLGD